LRQLTVNRAFTLVEILIVVVLLALLAAIVIPQFSNASQTAKASMLADNLRIMRSQIMVFRAQHQGAAPGYPGCDPAQTPTPEQFVAHMTLASSPAGTTAPAGTPGFQYGPYIREIPVNPINNLNTVRLLTTDADFAPSGSSGYAYAPGSLTLRADCLGADDTGRLYSDY
jgi:prepilin-type N-terminal cleavage/methylation domain-containing protein